MNPINQNSTAIEGYTIFNDNKNFKLYESKYGWINSTGYIEDFSLDNSNIFKTDFNAILNKNWLLINCYYVSLSVNYFNFDMNSIISMKVHYELNNREFFPYLEIETLPIKSYTGIHGAATAFAVLTLLTNIYNILRSTKDKRDIKDLLIREYAPYVGNEISYVTTENYVIYSFKRIYYNILYFFRYNFVTPNFFIFMSKFII